MTNTNRIVVIIYLIFTALLSGGLGYITGRADEEAKNGKDRLSASGGNTAFTNNSLLITDPSRDYYIHSLASLSRTEVASMRVKGDKLVYFIDETEATRDQYEAWILKYIARK